MDSVISFAKNNYDLITLMIAIVGVLVSVVSVIYEYKKRKSEKQ